MNCKSCGAELFFDPKKGMLHCEYCGSDFKPEEYEYTPDQGAKDEVIEQALSEEQIASAQAAGMTEAQAVAAAVGAHATDESEADDGLVVYKCPHCGAEVITSKDTAATSCVYCNRAITLEGNLSGTFKPDYVVPFTVTKEEAIKAYRRLARSSKLAPRAFTKTSAPKKLKGMYVPFWLYSFHGESRIAYTGTNTKVWVTGDTEYIETSTYSGTEGMEGDFKQIAEDGVKKLDNTLMDSIEPYDLMELRDFNPAYLAGFYAQRWDEDAGENEERAKSRARDVMHARTLDQAGSYGSISVNQEDYKWNGEKVELAMMPIWMMHTQYNGKDYIFGMNGQTGKIIGNIPMSTGKAFLYGGIAFVIIQIVLLILRVLGVLGQ